MMTANIRPVKYPVGPQLPDLHVTKDNGIESLSFQSPQGIISLILLYLIKSFNYVLFNSWKYLIQSSEETTITTW